MNGSLAGGGLEHHHGAGRASRVEREDQRPAKLTRIQPRPSALDVLRGRLDPSQAGG